MYSGGSAREGGVIMNKIIMKKGNVALIKRRHGVLQVRSSETRKNFTDYERAVKYFHREVSLVNYKRFMYNPSNEGNCEECPENRDMGDNGRLPCGQYRCWVTSHCY